MDLTTLTDGAPVKQVHVGSTPVREAAQEIRNGQLGLLDRMKLVRST